MNLEQRLNQRIGLPDIREITAHCIEKPEICHLLWQLACGEARPVSVNALWVLTHIGAAQRGWVEEHRDELIDLLLAATHAGKKRMLLQLLRNCKFGPGDVRTDLLDFCLSRINAECEAHAVRAFCIYLAFKMSRHFPDLVAELEAYLSMLGQQTLTPGLSCARNKTLKAMGRLTYRRNF